MHLINGPNKQTKYKQNRRLDQVTDDLVIDETDNCPFDPFLIVLLLFRLQRQLDEEDLLQLLIRVVDAELSEAVLVEDLEVVDVRGCSCLAAGRSSYTLNC